VDHHWLPVRYRIKFKTLLLIFKALMGKAPQYTRENCVINMVLNRGSRLHISCSLPHPFINPIGKGLMRGETGNWVLFFFLLDHKN
jgi:hypothetical protein